MGENNKRENNAAMEMAGVILLGLMVIYVLIIEQRIICWLLKITGRIDQDTLETLRESKLFTFVIFVCDFLILAFFRMISE